MAVHPAGLTPSAAEPVGTRRTAGFSRGLKAGTSFLLVIALTYLGLLAVTFFIGRVMPIDPVLAIVGDRAPEHVIARVREELGLNKPLYQQFYIYLGKVAQGDFGTSVLTSNPVMQDIRRTFPATIELATLGILIGAGLGVPLGVWAAVRRGGVVDQVVRVIGLIGYSVPIFWLGLMGLVLFYARLGWVGGPGRIDVTYEWDQDSLRHGQLIKLQEMPFLVRLFKLVATNGDIEWVITNRGSDREDQDTNGDTQARLTSGDVQDENAVRWQIEQLHRELKQLVGTEKCQCRTGRAQRNHLACCYLAWLTLKVHARKVGTTLYAAHANLLRDFLRAQLRQPTIAAYATV